MHVQGEEQWAQCNTGWDLPAWAQTMAGTRPSASGKLEEPPLLARSSPRQRLFLGAPRSQNNGAGRGGGTPRAGKRDSDADGAVLDDAAADLEAEAAGLAATLDAQSAVQGAGTSQAASASSAAQLPSGPRRGPDAAAPRAEPAASNPAAGGLDDTGAPQPEVAHLPQLQSSSSPGAAQRLATALDRRCDAASVPSAISTRGLPSLS